MEACTDNHKQLGAQQDTPCSYVLKVHITPSTLFSRPSDDVTRAMMKDVADQLLLNDNTPQHITQILVEKDSISYGAPQATGEITLDLYGYSQSSLGECWNVKGDDGNGKGGTFTTFPGMYEAMGVSAGYIKTYLINRKEPLECSCLSEKTPPPVNTPSSGIEMAWMAPLFLGAFLYKKFKRK